MGRYRLSAPVHGGQAEACDAQSGPIKRSHLDVAEPIQDRNRRAWLDQQPSRH